MIARKQVAVLIGSLRRESFSRKTANALRELAPATLDLQIVEIGHLPFYSEDAQVNTPAVWLEFRDRIRATDAVLFVTPEYNRSVPAVLKNAIDVGSRRSGPHGKNAWDGAPA